MLFLLATMSCIQAQSLDYRILHALQDRRTPGMDCAMRWVSNSLVLAPAMPIGLAIGGKASGNSQLSQQASQCTWSLGGTAIATAGLKYAIRRPRPYQQHPGELVPLTNPPSPSFPSGHTSFAFCAATSLSLCYPRWYVAAPAMLWASAVGFSRMYLGVHYPSDVLAGAVIGAAGAYITFLIQERLRQEQGLPAVNQSIAVPISIAF